MRAATDGVDRLTRLAIWLNDSRASRWIWPMMAQSVGSRDPLQMGLVPDEGAVQEFTTVSADPAFDDRVHPGRLDTAEHGPDPGVSEDGIERGGEVRAAVADHELDLCVPRTLSTSCDQAIFVDRATGPGLSSYAVLLKIDRFGQRFSGAAAFRER